ncbi:MAG TPA: metallophosphoesterase [Acidimicrobiia bacterium]|nr:metallophosphoesterase [Acidimicrobiia bacterium]
MRSRRLWFVATSLLCLTGVVPVRPAQASNPVLIGAGDIATCSGSADSKTAALIASSGGTVFTAGDNVYDRGSAAQFANCYKPTWGKFKSRTHPAVGDNEYDTPKASGYWDYFGSAAGARNKGWYSYDLGTWHIVVLNSNCSKVGGCGRGSAQEQWLRADLAKTKATCIAAIWHQPRFSSVYGNNGSTKPFWQDLYAAGADIVINGHHHAYERFAPQDPSGHKDAHGIRQFTVGTGGAPLAHKFKAVQPNSQVRNANTYGVLKLTLHSKSYDFSFIPVAGSSFHDSGSGTC